MHSLFPSAWNMYFLTTPATIKLHCTQYDAHDHIYVHCLTKDVCSRMFFHAQLLIFIWKQTLMHLSTCIKCDVDSQAWT